MNLHTARVQTDINTPSCLYSHTVTARLTCLYYINQDKREIKCYKIHVLLCSHDNEVQSVSQTAANNNIISLTSERVDKQNECRLNLHIFSSKLIIKLFRESDKCFSQILNGKSCGVRWRGWRESLLLFLVLSMVLHNLFVQSPELMVTGDPLFHQVQQICKIA